MAFALLDADHPYLLDAGGFPGTRHTPFRLYRIAGPFKTGLLLSFAGYQLTEKDQ
jgi:hypothetical protein